MQPILVRRQGDTENYELIAGERRWRAAQIAGLTEIPAIVRDVTDEQAAEFALIENIQREDLNAMDRAWALRSLAERFALTHEQLASRVGLDRSTVANLIRLTDLEPEIANMVATSKISAGHARALLAFPSGPTRLELARLAGNFQWSVRKLEAMAKQTQHAQPKQLDTSPRAAVLRDLEKQVGEYLGTKVSILTDKQGKRGKMIFEFYGLDHFDGLLSRLGIPTK